MDYMIIPSQTGHFTWRDSHKLTYNQAFYLAFYLTYFDLA